MTPQFHPQTGQLETLCVSRLIPVLLGAILLMGGFAPLALGMPVDCQSVGFLRVGDGWNDRSTSLSVVEPTLTLQRNLYGPLGPAAVFEAAPPLKNSRIGRSNAENRGWTGLGTCWTQPFRKNTVVDQAMIKSPGKGSSKAFMQVMRVPILPYQGKRYILQTRTILPDIATFPRQITPSLIGPVQENLPAGPSSTPTLQQAITLPLASDESLFLFGGRPILPTDTLKTSIRLPVNESLRMNMTTTQALHGGNCAHGCP